MYPSFQGNLSEFTKLTEHNNFSLSVKLRAILEHPFRGVKTLKINSFYNFMRMPSGWRRHALLLGIVKEANDITFFQASEREGKTRISSYMAHGTTLFFRAFHVMLSSVPNCYNWGMN